MGRLHDAINLKNMKKSTQDKRKYHPEYINNPVNTDLWGENLIFLIEMEQIIEQIKSE